MIEVIYIEGFQNHKDTEIEFDPGFNVIHGITDSGKSAVIRAMNWCINNRPGGDSFRNGEYTEVCIGVEEGQISRVKDSSNLYLLNETEFKAFGQSVQEEVSAMFNINEINFQPGQFNAPFLLSNSPGEVARILNKIAKIDDIDKATSAIAKKIKENNNLLFNKTFDLKTHKKELSEFDIIDTMEEELTVIERLKKKKKSLKEKTKLLEDKIEKTEEIKEELKTFREVDREELVIEGILPLFKTKSALETKIDGLSVLLHNISRTKELLTESEVKIKQKEKEFKEIFPEECPLCGK